MDELSRHLKAIEALYQECKRESQRKDDDSEEPEDDDSDYPKDYDDEVGWV